MAPISRMMLELVEAANAAGAIDVDDTRRAAALMQQTVMYSWFGNRLAKSARKRLTAEATWEFCLHGLRRLIARAAQTRSRSSIRIALPRSTL